MNRQEAYKKLPILACETDWLVAHDKQLKKLYKKFKKDTGDNMTFIAFSDFVYNNAQDLINQEN